MPLTDTYTLTDAVHLAVAEFRSDLQEEVSNLLQGKHLYQRVQVDPEATQAKYESRVEGSQKAIAPQILQQWLTGKLTLVWEDEDLPQQGPVYVLKNLKLYCSQCSEREVFSCIWAHDLGQDEMSSPSKSFPRLAREKHYQGILLVYQCQRCKRDPSIFIIRRVNWNFILEGRSPIEEIEVPIEIPKQERAFFRDSIIAFQSGKPLPGILYLRVFIESFCRRVTGTTTRETGEELTSRYKSLLKPEQNSQMPSLKELYERLSEAIHDGREDSVLYTEAREEIIRHFEFRRLFRIE